MAHSATAALHGHAPKRAAVYSPNCHGSESTDHPAPASQEFGRGATRFVPRSMGLPRQHVRNRRARAGIRLRSRRLRPAGARRRVRPAELGHRQPQAVGREERHRSDAGQLPLGPSRRVRQLQGSHSELGPVRCGVHVLHALLPRGAADCAGAHQPADRPLHVSVPPVAGSVSGRPPPLAGDSVERGLPHVAGQRHLPLAQAVVRVLPRVRRREMDSRAGAGSVREGSGGTRGGGRLRPVQASRRPAQRGPGDAHLPRQSTRVEDGRGSLHAAGHAVGGRLARRSAAQGEPIPVDRQLLPARALGSAGQLPEAGRPGFRGLADPARLSVARRCRGIP